MDLFFILSLLAFVVISIFELRSSLGQLEWFPLYHAWPPWKLAPFNPLMYIVVTAIVVALAIWNYTDISQPRWLVALFGYKQTTAYTLLVLAGIRAFFAFVWNPIMRKKRRSI
jgi:hypothetical protein